MEDRKTIRESLKKLDLASSVIDKLNESTYRKHIIVPRTKNERTKIRFKNIITDEIFESEIQHIAVYHSKTRVFCWAWNIGLLNDIEIDISRKIWNIASTSKEHQKIVKHILTLSRSIIEEPFQISVNLALWCSMVKNYYVITTSLLSEETGDSRDVLSDTSLVEGDSITYYILLLNETILDGMYERIHEFSVIN